MTTSIEQFCRGFLSGNQEYKHLYDILCEYVATFERIDIHRVFHSKETFTTSFPTICTTVLRLRGTDSSYVLAILGFVLHVHAQYKNLQWYDVELMLVLLVKILTSINFNPAQYCKCNTCYIL